VLSLCLNTAVFLSLRTFQQNSSFFLVIASYLKIKEMLDTSLARARMF